MVINLEIIAGWVVTIAAIGTPLTMLLKQAGKLLERLSKLESWNIKQQEDIEHSKEERAILLSGTLACLKGLQEQGCNGAVTASISEIEAFLLAEAHRGKSIK